VREEEKELDLHLQKEDETVERNVRNINTWRPLGETAVVPW